MLLATLILRTRAGVAELADALDSKSSARKGVEVQVLSPVLKNGAFAPRVLFADGVIPGMVLGRLPVVI